MDYCFEGYLWAPLPVDYWWGPGSILLATIVVRTIRCLCYTISSRFYMFLARFSGRRRQASGSAGVRGGTTNCPIIRTPAHCRMPPPLAAFFIVFSTLLGIAEACSSRSTPKPRPPTPTARPNITFHTYRCPDAYATWYCLNGATCFTVMIGESMLYNCECADGYMGQRCEFKDLDGSYLPARQRVMLETASIAGGATIAVLLVVIVGIVMYIRLQRRKKQSQTECSVVDGSSRDLERRPLPFSSYSHSIPMERIQLSRVKAESSAIPESSLKMFPHSPSRSTVHLDSTDGSQRNLPP